MADDQTREEGLSAEELGAQDAQALPDREAMSTLDPTAGLDAGGVVGGVTDAVGGAVGGATDALPGTVGAADGLVPNIDNLSLLNLEANVDLTADAAAPVSAAVAANANVAAPIDAAVSANVASPDAVSLAGADQHSVIVQDLDGTADASVDQDSSIAQGETPPADGSAS
jgi:hypothetical protein